MATQLTSLLDMYLKPGRYSELTAQERRLVTKANVAEHPVTFLQGAIDAMLAHNIHISDAMKDVWEVLQHYSYRLED